MLLLNCIFLAISVSIDSLGIGITYGIKNTKLSINGKVILFLLSLCITSISIFFGNIIKGIFSDYFAKLIGSTILTFMGIFIIFQSIKKDTIKKPCNQSSNSFTYIINFLGITIQIIKNPSSSDLDNSNKIDAKEAFFLGIALSLDAFCIGIGSSAIGINSSLFPILVATFQLFFLNFGNLIGRKLNNLSNIPQNIWSIISGFMLTFIGILKFWL